MPTQVEKKSMSDGWLEAEITALVRDFGMFRILRVLATLSEPNVADATDDILRSYSIIDSESGAHNVVSLADIRRVVPLDRKSFDQALFRLISGHRMNLVPANVCYRMNNEEHEACFKYGTERYLFVSKVIVPVTKQTARPTHYHDPDEKPEKPPKPLTAAEKTELALDGKPVG